MNNTVQKRLKEVYRLYAATRMLRNRSIKLPSALGIEKDGDGLLLRLPATAATANMQTDAGSAEAWALMLRLWLGEAEVPHIVLDWEVPSEVKDGHYQRFLYRVAQFQTLFPEWFRLASPPKLTKCAALTAPVLLINVPSKRKPPSLTETSSPEYRLELELLTSEPFREHFGLKRELIDRQFPVGLFAEAVRQKNRVFTGGKSAIDLVGVGQDDRFFVFELKAGKNIKVGALSELLLYTGLMREAAQNEPRIKFTNAKPSPGTCVYPSHVKDCTGIHSVIVVENLHPLLDHPELISTLNKAAEVHWNRPGVKPVCFRTARVSDFERASKAKA